MKLKPINFSRIMVASRLSCSRLRSSTRTFEKLDVIGGGPDMVKASAEISGTQRVSANRTLRTTLIEEDRASRPEPSDISYSTIGNIKIFAGLKANGLLLRAINSAVKKIFFETLVIRLTYLVRVQCSKVSTQCLCPSGQSPLEIAHYLIYK